MAIILILKQLIVRIDLHLTLKRVHRLFIRIHTIMKRKADDHITRPFITIKGKRWLHVFYGGKYIRLISCVELL